MRSRLLGCALVVAAMSVVAVNGQTEVKRTTKVEVKAGKEITTTGCVDRMGDGRYSLTGVRGVLCHGRQDASGLEADQRDLVLQRLDQAGDGPTTLPFFPCEPAR